jgi:sugar lactone lactonase YvrE
MSKHTFFALGAVAVLTALVGCPNARLLVGPQAATTSGWVDANDGGDATKVVTPSFTQSRKLAAVQSANGLASIDHIDYQLSRGTTIVANKTMSGATATGAVTFAHLRNGVTYNVNIQVYSAPSSSAANLISLPSVTPFTMTGNDDTQSLAGGFFKVTLADKVFNGHDTVSGVAVTGGAYTPNGFVQTQPVPAPTNFQAPKGIAYNSTTTSLYLADNVAQMIYAYQPTAGTNVAIAGNFMTPGYTNATGLAASFNGPEGVVANANGTLLFVADTNNSAIRQIVVASGVVTTFAGIAVATAPPPAADGMGILARFNAPRGLAMDSGGNLYVADSGNHTIRMIDSSGLVTTIGGSALAVPGNVDNAVGTSATFVSPSDLALSPLTNKLYITDNSAHTVRCMDLKDVNHPVTTLAGTAGSIGSTDGNGTGASFNGPRGIAVDKNGWLYVADVGNRVIRKIDPTDPNHPVTTFAGSGAAANTDGYATGAAFQAPFGVAYDTTNSALFITDGSRIRRID